MRSAIRTIRKIIEIDEEKCNGCGRCIPNCREGALRLVNGKVKLVNDRYCDGLGACLGHCPQGAIRLVECPPEALEEQPAAAQEAGCACGADASQKAVDGCPASRAIDLKGRLRQKGAPAAGGGAKEKAASALANWPVQLALVPVNAPYLRGADILLAADCAGFSCPDFHGSLLFGKILLVACPKLDDAQAYVEKLALIFRKNEIRSLTIVHMEVPCCSGLKTVVAEAMDRAGAHIPVEDVVVGIEGEMKDNIDSRRIF
ncbi:MAG: 4Fe-4S binding protein [Candidatus Velamenicoccus archaeovorus]